MIFLYNSMYIPKRYGQSKDISCPFCGKQAIAKNKQGLNVCVDHKNQAMEEVKCTCGSWLEQKVGKFGPYFNCLNCGNINFNKAMEMKEIMKQKETKNKSLVEDVSKAKQQKAKIHPKKSEDKFILDSGKYDNFDYGIQ